MTKGRKQTREDIITKRLEQEREKEAIKNVKSFDALSPYQKEVIEKSTKTAHKALLFLDKIYQGQSFPLSLHKNEHLYQKYQADLQRISYLLGYDKAYVDEDQSVYFYKDDVAYRVNGS